MIMKLKQEFYFNYKSKQIKVQKLNTVYCAIFGDIAKILQNRGVKQKKINLGLDPWGDKLPF